MEKVLFAAAFFVAYTIQAVTGFAGNIFAMPVGTHVMGLSSSVAVLNAMGFFGGLVMSAIKRDRGVKDWGHMIEGHGGMLDRLDSVTFAAPVFFHVVRYGFS